MTHNDGSMRPRGAMLLTGDLASGWVRWIYRFQFFMLETEKTTTPGTVQVAMQLTLEAIDIIRTFEWENAVDKDDIDQVKTKFATYFAPRQNVTYERYTFMKRIQKLGEPFDTFVTDLRNLIRTCENHVYVRDNLLRDQIVLGITSEAVREKLFYPDSGETKCTLLIAVDICRNSEITGQLMQHVSVDTSNVEEVPVHAMTGKQGKAKHRYSDDKATTNQWN